MAIIRIQGAVLGVALLAAFPSIANEPYCIAQNSDDFTSDVVFDGDGNARTLTMSRSSLQGVPSRIDEIPAAEALLSSVLSKYLLCSGETDIRFVVRDAHDGGDTLVFFYDVYSGKDRYLDLAPTLAVLKESVVVNGYFPEDMTTHSTEVAAEDHRQTIGLALEAMDIDAASRSEDCLNGCSFDGGYLEVGLFLLGGKRQGVQIYRDGGKMGFNSGDFSPFYVDDGIRHLNDYTRTCRVRRHTWSSSGASLHQTSGTTSDDVRCTADAILNTCTWYMKYWPSGTSHEIHQVLDANGPEPTDVQSCSSSSAASFQYISSNYLRQQDGFYAMYTSRSRIKDNAWNNYSPIQNGDLRLVVNDSSVQTATYTSWDQRIRCNAAANCGDSSVGGFMNCCSMLVLEHEYGHYVNWTYGDFSGTCINLVSEGTVLEETLAHAWSVFISRDDPNVNPDYGAIGAVPGSVYPDEHGSNNTVRQAGDGVCASSGTQLKAERALVQALWELMYNRNCGGGSTACTPTSVYNTGLSRIFLMSKDAAMERIGEAMAFAGLVTPSNGLAQQWVTNFENRIGSDIDNATKQRVAAVFAHHGY